MKTKFQYAVVALSLVLVISCSKESDETAVYPVAQNVTAMESELLDLVNTHRESLGQKALSFSANA